MRGLLLRRMLCALFRVRLVGCRAAPDAAAPALIVANHPGVLDPVLLANALDINAVIIASRHAMRNRWVRWASIGLEVIPADLSEAILVRRIARLLALGRSVVLFPENRPTRSHAPTKIYEAPAIAAARSGVPVLPVHLRYGCTTVDRRSHRGLLVTVGERERIVLPAGLSGRERRRQATDRLISIMQRAKVAAVPEQTLFEAFVDAAETHGARTPIIEDVRQIEESYGTLLKMSLALGRLIGRHSSVGQVIGVLLPNTVAAVGSVLGMSATGRVPALLNYSSGPEAVGNAVRCAGITTVITSRRFVEVARLERVLRALSGCEIFYLEDLRARLSIFDKIWLVGWARWRPRSVVSARTPDDLALVLFTSGSEGKPKGVGLSHRAVLANMRQLAAAIDFDRTDKFLNALPMYHTYGLIACTLMPIVYGTRLFLYTNALHFRVIPEIAYSRDCTYLFGTSTFLGRYAQHARAVDFGSVRYAISGGEKLNAEVERVYRSRFGLRIFEGYGSTECGPAIALNTAQWYRAGTVGRFLPGVEFQLVPVPGIQRGGMLHVRSPNLMLGYFLHDRPGELQPVSSSMGAGWHAMGDIVEVDAEGFVTVLGRLRRFAKVAGEMVPLELVEQVARECAPQHQHAAAVTLAGDRGETTVLFTTDAGLDRFRLHQTARRLGIQDLAVARHVVHVESLPVLGTGKTDYVALADLVAAAEKTPESVMRAK